MPNASASCEFTLKMCMHSAELFAWELDNYLRTQSNCAMPLINSSRIELRLVYLLGLLLLSGAIQTV